MDWTTAWQLAGEVCDLLAEDDIETTARQHERIANKLSARDGHRFNSHSQTWLPDKTKKEAEQGWAMFEFAVRLTGHAEREKRLAHGEERSYWQGTTDACRKLTNIFNGQGMFSELFQELANPPARPANRT